MAHAARLFAILLLASSVLLAGEGTPLGIRLSPRHEGSVPAGTGRAWGLVIAWGEVEREAGKPDWAGVDRLLAAVDAAGRESVPVLAPRHAASPRTDLGSAYAKALKDPASGRERDWLPPDLDAWLAFVRAVVRRYGPGAEKPRLKRPATLWQLSEEFPRGWAGSDAEFVEFARRTAAAVRDADPSARIVLPYLPADDLALFAFSDGAIGGPDCQVERGRFPRAAMAKNLRVQAERKRFLGVLAKLGGACDFVDVHLSMRIEYVGPCLGWIRDQLDRVGSRAGILSSRGGGPLETAGEAFDHTTWRRRLVEHAAIALASGAVEVAWDWDPPPASLGEGLRRLPLSTSSDAAADWERLAALLAGSGRPEWVDLPGGRGVRFAKDGSWIGVVWGDGGEISWPGSGTVRLIRSDGLEEGELVSVEGGWKVRAEGLPRYLIPQ